MKLDFRGNTLEDLKYWISNNRKIALRIFELLDDIQKTPFSGIGKPEPLKFNLSGCWSRRIDSEHRLVYTIQKETIIIYSCRFHYD
jgi:toxin YoeB